VTRRLSLLCLVGAVTVTSCVGPTTSGPNGEMGNGTTQPVVSFPPHVARLVERFDIPPEQLAWVPPRLWDDIRVDPSEVQTEAESGGYFEHRAAWARWLASCYTAAGYPAVTDPPGSGHVRYRGANAAEFATSPAKQRCDAESLLRFPPGSPPSNREEWRAVYRRKLDTAACLEAEGHDVPEAPSLEAFIDSGGEWDPYLAVEDVPYDEWNRLLATCPQP